MKKLLSIMLSVAIVATMLAAFGITVSAESPTITENGIINCTTLDEFYAVAENVDEYITNGATTIKLQIASNIAKNCNFKSINVSLENATVQKDVTVKTDNYLSFNNGILAGNLEAGVVAFVNTTEIKTTAKILCNGMTNINYDMSILAYSHDVDFVNNGTIELRNTGVIKWSTYQNSFNSFENKGMIYATKNPYDVINTSGFSDKPYGHILNNTVGNKTTAVTLGKYDLLPKKINQSDTLGNGSGDSSVTMNGETIPAPTYTVTIPEKIEFGSVSKKLNSTSNADAIVKTASYTVTADYEYLFENQKNLTVTMSTENKIVNGKNEIAFKLLKADGSVLSSETDVFSIQPTAVEKKTVTQELYATLDQRLIKASGDYTGTVTFTVALADNK